MRKFIRSTLRLIAQWWEVMQERDARIGHQRFVENVTREGDFLRWRRNQLAGELFEIACRHRAGPIVCENQATWELEPTQRKLHRIDGLLDALEDEITVHARLCDRSGHGPMQAALH